MESKGYPKYFWSVNTSVAATWIFINLCIYDWSYICLDQVSLAYPVENMSTRDEYERLGV